MLRNYNYDLVEELNQKSKSIWRYEQYLKDASGPGCEHCRDIWQRLREQDEVQVEMLKNEIKSHVKSDIFD